MFQYLKIITLLYIYINIQVITITLDKKIPLIYDSASDPYERSVNNTTDVSSLGLVSSLETECPKCVIPTIVFAVFGVLMVVFGVYFLIKEHYRKRRTHKFENTNNSRTHCNSLQIIYQ